MYDFIIATNILLFLGNGDLSVPEQQPRRYSTGHINIAALQPNLENLKLQQNVSMVKLKTLLHP